MKLYHATFKDLLPLIKKNGLGNSPYKNWNDSDNKFVYLASDPYEAESYCEATEEENYYVDSDIIIFEIDTKAAFLKGCFLVILLVLLTALKGIYDRINPGTGTGKTGNNTGSYTCNFCIFILCS